MIHRRHFLGSMAAAGFAGATTSSLFANPIDSSPSKALKWRCDIVSTIAHGYAKRAPVVTGVSLQPSSNFSEGNLVAIAGDDHYVCIYDMQKKEFEKHIGEHTDWIRATSFSPDGRFLASAGNDRMLRLWNAQDWNEKPRTIRHREAIIDIAFSNDSTKIATVGFESALRVYNTQTGQQLFSRNCMCSDNHAIAFSPDDQMLAAGGRSGEICIWDVNGNKISTLKSHRKRIRSLQFAGNDKIVSCSDDQMVKITNAKNPADTQSLPRHASKLYDILLLDDDVLATAGSDNIIHVWRISDLTELGVLKGHTGTVTSLSSSKTKLASGSYDTQVRIWERDARIGLDRQTQLPQTQLPGWNGKHQ